MAGNFIDNIAGTVTAAPGTGSFTFTGTLSLARDWSNAPTTQIYPYRAEEVSVGWEIGLGVWNGTTLTRNVLYSSNSNAAVSFGTGVVVSLTEQAEELMGHIGGLPWGMWLANPGITTGPFTLGLGAPTLRGTQSTPTMASTNAVTRRRKNQIASATTANALAGYEGLVDSGVLFSTDSADVGFEFCCRFGFGTIPTGPKVLIGLAAAAITTGEPSANNNTLALAKDSTDTNLQLLRRSATAATKVDLGLAPAANTSFEFSMWKNPGNQEIMAVLINPATPSIVITRIAAGAANLPVNNTAMRPQVIASLSSTTGTAVQLMHQHTLLRELA